MKSLTVDDVLVVQKILSRMLGRHGSCDVASNGKDALEMFRKANQQNEPYDVLFLDIMMPGMSGLELLQKIRQIDSGAEPVKIVMVTAVADNQTVDEAKRLGCDGYIIKPLRANEIDEVLRGFKLI